MVLHRPTQWHNKTMQNCVLIRGAGPSTVCSSNIVKEYEVVLRSYKIVFLVSCNNSDTNGDRCQPYGAVSWCQQVSRTE